MEINARISRSLKRIIDILSEEYPQMKGVKEKLENIYKEFLMSLE